MTDGETLYRIFDIERQRVGLAPLPPWLQFNVPEQLIWERTADMFALGVRIAANPVPIHDAHPDPRYWKALLVKYGRHSASCGFSSFFQTPCTCGFAEIEATLTQ